MPNPTPKVAPIDLPAGHARNEALAKVKDELEEQADSLVGQGANLAAIAPDEELQHQLEVSEMYRPQPGWSYRWVYIGAQGRDMTKGYMQHQVEGWKPVKASDPEVADYPECVNAFGMFVVGDTALMKIPAGRKAALDERDRLRQQAREASTLEEAQGYTREAAKKLGLPIKIIDNHEEVAGTLDALHAAAPKFVGSMKAQSQFDQMIRAGNIPGVKLTTQTL